jgi:hypothetical protein
VQSYDEKYLIPTFFMFFFSFCCDNRLKKRQSKGGGPKFVAKSWLPVVMMADGRGKEEEGRCVMADG